MRKEPPKTVYIIHPGDGSYGGGELYASKTEADHMAAELCGKLAKALDEHGAPVCETHDPRTRAARFAMLAARSRTSEPRR